ncbi:unnamed protein product [Angiostrongylus costaricensis]|uniref:N-acetyltransferase domain-containing protein n=1 Tax=Angiostrongylus costaricensis TaxID=334426 RepID=A0A0R3PI23_ANGCS|nr:unnamed protein product [Angiostrongylus costaricensis]
MDRLFSYEFSDPQLRIAIEFLKSVFNRADVAYHLEENNISKPVFLAIIAVHANFWNKGIGSALLDKWLVSLFYLFATYCLFHVAHARFSNSIIIFF